MSGIAGIFNRDGRPVDPDLLARMTDAIAHRGPDGAGYWVDGAVGFGHQMLCTTPESLREQQPLRDQTGQLCLVLDGRVDNRAELQAALEARGARLRDDTDAELVLRAYEVWGEACAKEIIGDFAFAIWDARKQQLFCARDFLGIKPFYYHVDNHTFRFGSELHQILEDTSIVVEPNEGMIAEYLAIWIQNREETLYHNIYRLPPAHYLVVRPGHIRIECYWTVGPVKELRYRTDREYAEHFLELFKEAVRCRLRCHMPVGAYLSGGLDSSSIVGVCQSLLRDEGLKVPRFETFSMLFPDRPECDESQYIQQMIDWCDVKSNVVYPKLAPHSWYAKQAHTYRDFPDYPIGTSGDSVMELAQALGFRVLLTGYGGDEWLTGNRYCYADMLRQLKIRDLMSEINCSLALYGIKYTLHQMLLYGIRPLFPQALRGLVRNILATDQVPKWIDSQFADRTQLISRIKRLPIAAIYGSYARYEMHRTLIDGSQVHGNEVGERSASRFAIEERHPFHDRRLVGFAFSLPGKQHFRNEQTKSILREAMRGMIPEAIRERTDKAEFSHLFIRAFRVQGGKQNYDNMALSRLGWIRESEIDKMYNSMDGCYAKNDDCYTKYVWQLWMIFGIEQWLKMNSVNKYPVLSEDITID